MLPSGDYGDMAVDVNGVQYLVIEAPGRASLLVYRRQREDLSLLHTLDGAAWDASGVRFALYPRIACRPDGGQIAVVYQRGSVLALVLRDEAQAVLVTWPESDTPFGVEMVGIQWMGGRWRMGGIVQRGRGGPIRLVAVDYLPDGAEVRRAERATDTTQGISRIDAAGTVHLVDEERIDPRWPDLHRPCVAGSLVCGENMSGPERVLGYQTGASMRLRFFVGSGKQPRAIQTPTGYTVMAMGRGVARFVDGPPFDLDEQDEPVPVLERITRPCWAGWFKTTNQFDPSGAWRAQASSWAHVESTQAAREAIANGLAVVCSVDVALASDAILANTAAIWCQGPQGEGADVDAVGWECRRALAMLAEDNRPTRPPILAYVDDAQPAGWPASCEWNALQMYCSNDETVKQAEQRFLAQLARLPNKPIVLVVQAWDRRTTADGQGQPLAKVEALQAVWPRLVNGDSRVRGVLAFAFGRAGGGTAHPSLARLQAEIAAGIPGVPELVRIKDQEEEEEEPVPVQPYPDENSWWNEFTSAVNARYQKANVTGNDGKFKWFARTAYDIAAGTPADTSKKKHLNELNAALGLPPDP